MQAHMDAIVDIDAWSGHFLGFLQQQGLLGSGVAG